MKQSLGFNGIVLGGAAALMAIQPALAAPIQVTGVQLNQTASGVDVMLQTQSGARPQVFAVNRGNSWTADLPSSQLRLAGGKSFRKDNPAPGIASVTVAPLNATSIRVTVVGKAGVPVGQVVRPDQGGIVLSVSPFGTKQAAAASIAPPPTPARSYSIIAQPPVAPSAAALAPAAPIAVPLPEKPSTLAQAQTQPAPSSSPPAVRTAPTTPVPTTPAPITAPAARPTTVPTNQTAPLLPNPEIQVKDATGAVVPPGVQGVAPRAVPPPTGDIATAQVDASGTTIDLGSAERVPRLVLRDAPAREVLGLLARAAGLNLAFVGDLLAQGGQPGQAAPGGQAATASDGPKVSLDIENEPVQNVFNYVLQITGLEANRIGRTVFIGPKLPNSARNLVVRSVRLNQASITSAINFLVTLGAESAVSRDRLVTNAVATPVGTLAGGGSTAITQTQTATESRIENQRVNYIDSTPLLRGLQISGDERTNQVTLVGEPKKVAIAISQLAQLDIRRRQVTVNVRVVDVNLSSSDVFAANASFGVDNTFVTQQNGVAVVNLGRSAPSAAGVVSPISPSTIGNAAGAFSGAAFNFARNFLLQLQASVASGNAKILTDPTLLIQEGQTATVNVTEEVVTNITQQTTASTNSTQTTITVEKGRAGLILPIKVDRVDDNGFVSLSIAPSISRIAGTVGVNVSGNVNNINLLSERRLESGQVRLRDGQTLLLTGVIQDEDRTTVNKVPILGDIPLLGALFRSTNRLNQRREVIVIVTPRVLDDSQQATFGYGYAPSPAVQQVLNDSNKK